MHFRTFSCGYILTNLYRALKKQIIYIFCINIVVFDSMFYSQDALRSCIIGFNAIKNCESQVVILLLIFLLFATKEKHRLCVYVDWFVMFHNKHT